VATNTKLYVGIDLGGTNLKLGLVSADGQLIARHSCPTEAPRGPQHVLGRMAGGTRDLCRTAGVALADVAAIGAAVPGPLDTKAGLVVFAPNLPGWRMIHVRDVLQRDLGRPVVVENDANAAGYGEFRCGAARTVRDMFLLTLGTGIGGGIILDGRMFRGTTDTGAELGHTLISYAGRQCGCGNKGCLEAYASATAVVARTEERIAGGEKSSLAGQDKVSCKAVFDAAAEGDPLAVRIIEETADYLAAGITSLMHVLNPEMVVLTGGMMGAGDAFLERIRRRVREKAIGRAAEKCEIRWSSLEGDAGILGAALAAEAFDRTGQPA
jgi:glucokinase